jgi:hypothetical protein
MIDQRRFGDAAMWRARAALFAPATMPWAGWSRTAASGRRKWPWTSVPPLTSSTSRARRTRAENATGCERGEHNTTYSPDGRKICVCVSVQRPPRRREGLVIHPRGGREGGQPRAATHRAYTAPLEIPRKHANSMAAVFAVAEAPVSVDTLVMPASCVPRVIVGRLRCRAS